MEPLYQSAWLIPVLPLLGALIVGFGLIAFSETTSKLRRPSAIFIMALMAIAMGHSLSLFWSQVQGHAPYTQMIEWAAAGNLHIAMGYVIDPLAALMLVIVTTVAFLVMLYSDGYMAHDPGYVRFFAYLSLFGSSMLGLVVSPNLVQVYIFWELVGMCSYLLIGFWYDRKSAAEAAQKAFVTNRVGDFGLLLGMVGLFWATGTFEFAEMGDRLTELVNTGLLSPSLAAILAILVFLGPVAKSAQFPLHVWLPDAMEGPTPISALIHAATMVAAGVFLIARMFPVFEQLPPVMTIIAWTGAFTAFMGATIALTQNDIKKSLAYSTISQLGYMVMGMGVGAYSAGLFHLMTHAYFKAMLFLGSGSVIHGMEGVVGHNPDLAQDMRYMGGLRKYMPITAATFLVGCLAISGVPPFAGFWSKDEILGAVFHANPAMWGLTWLTAGLTAFYMFRIYFMTFEGKFRNVPPALREHPDHHAAEPHESPWTMTLPLVVLAIPSTLIGFVGTPFNNLFEAFIHAPAEEIVAEHAVDLTEFLILGSSSVGIGLVGITLASLMYLKGRPSPQAIAKAIQPLYRFSLHKWYFDELYEAVFIKGCRRLARQVLEVDYNVVDGVVNLTGFVTMVTGEGLKYFQNGRAQFYALIVLLAVLGFVIFSVQA